jgi:predicted PurR-regulated permease PerM
MENRSLRLKQPRVAFLLLLAVAISLLFYWLISDFLLALLVAAVLAALVHPFYLRVARMLRERKGIAAGVTVLLCLVLVIIPMLLFLGILVDEAMHMSESARAWIANRAQDSGALQQKLEEDSDLRHLLPYQDEIIAKAGQLASRAGSFVAGGLAAGAKSTAEFLFMLFVMLCAMTYFLVDGKAILDAVLRFTPLTDGDKGRLLGTFASVGRATIKGTLIIGIVQGGLAGLSFWVAGIEGPVFWAAVMMVLSIIPGVGTALIWVPAVIFLVLNGQVGAAVGVGLWCGIVVGTADNVLRPLLIGRDTQMPDLLVMLTTLGGLALFGPPGLLVGPIIGALYVAVWELFASATKEDAGETAANAQSAAGE